MIMFLTFTLSVESADIPVPPKKVKLKKLRNHKFLPKIQNYGDSKSNGQVNISQSL